jgi:hypothetical protein
MRHIYNIRYFIFANLAHAIAAACAITLA